MHKLSGWHTCGFHLMVRFQGHQPDWQPAELRLERQKVVACCSPQEQPTHSAVIGLVVAGCGRKVKCWAGGSKPKEEEPYFTSQQGVGTLNVVRGGWAGEGWHNISTPDLAAAIEKYSTAAWNHVRYCWNIWRNETNLHANWETSSRLDFFLWNLHSQWLLSFNRTLKLEVLVNTGEL